MAIAAGGKNIVFSGKKVTITDKKTGDTRVLQKTSSGGYVQVSKTSGSSSSGGTKVSVVSDAPEDVGKSFGGTTIQTPQQYAQTPSGQALQQSQIQNLSQEVQKKILAGGSLNQEDVRRATQAGISQKQLLKYADELRKYKASTEPKIQVASYGKVFGKPREESLIKPKVSEFKTPELRDLKLSLTLKKDVDTNLEQARTMYINPLRVVTGVAAGVVSIKNVVKNPSLFVEGVKTAVSNPKETLKATAYGFASDPFAFYGEGLVYSKVLSVAGRGIKFSNAKIGEIKNKIKTDVKALEVAKKPELKAKLIKSINNDLKKANNLIKKEIEIKRLPKENIPVITPKIVKKIKTDAKYDNLTKHQNILDNTNYNKQTLKAISQEAKQYGYVIKPVKLNKPIFDLTNNRIITLRYVLLPKSIKATGKGKLSRLAKKQSKRVLTEKELAKQIKKQIPKDKIIDISEVKIIENIVQPTKVKNMFNKKGSLQISLLKQELKTQVAKEKVKYQKQTRVTTNKVKLMSRKGNKVKLTEKKLKEVKTDLNKLAKEYNRLDNKVKSIEKLSKKAKYKKALLPIIKDLKNIKFALAKDIKFVKQQLKRQLPIREPIKAQKPKLEPDKIQKPKQAQDVEQTPEYKPKGEFKTDFKPKTEYKPKPITTQKPKPKEEPIKKNKFKISSDSKQLDNKVLTFKGVYRERKYPNLKAGSKNHIVTKTITIKDTKNRALKRVAQKVDNNLARSIQLKVVGIGKYKKDISKPKILTKFRQKKSKNTPVLKLVEKSKYTLDKKGEKKTIKNLKSKKKSVNKHIKFKKTKK